MTVVIIELVVLVSLGGIGDGRGGLDGCDERNFSVGVVVVVVIVGGGRCCRGDGDCDRGGGCRLTSCYHGRWNARDVRSGQRIYISDRTHSIPLRLPNMCLTQPLPALSVAYIEYTTPTT